MLYFWVELWIMFFCILLLFLARLDQIPQIVLLLHQRLDQKRLFLGHLVDEWVTSALFGVEFIADLWHCGEGEHSANRGVHSGEQNRQIILALF